MEELSKEDGQTMILALLDISGIQKFIFATNKLKEIVGASTIVQRALEVDLLNLPDVDAESWKSDAFVWSDGKDQAQIVYIGGGNAMLAFVDENIARKTLRELQERVFLNSGGGIRLCKATAKEEWNAKVQQMLIDRVKSYKNENPPIRTLQGFSLNALDNDTYEPILNLEAVYHDRTEPLSFYTTASRKRKQEAFKAFNKNSNYISDMEDFYSGGNEARKRFLGVIHIDGNSMGKQIQDFVKSNEDLNSIRQLSQEITGVYQKAMEEAEKSLNLQPVDKKGKLPFRQIIANGDDVTVICRSSDAFEYAQAFVDALMGENERSSNGFHYSVGIGIAFVNLSFPFSTGAAMAEELCQSAKKFAKEYKEKNGLTNDVSSIDFQVCYGGLAGSVDDFRERNYIIDSRTKHRLDLRPYLFSSEGNSFSECFEARYKAVVSSNLARSKLIGLRDAYGKGVHVVEDYVSFLKAREGMLPDGLCKDKIWEEGSEGWRRACYFDILDVMGVREVWDEVEENGEDQN
jgi:hypothetical protein